MISPGGSIDAEAGIEPEADAGPTAVLDRLRRCVGAVSLAFGRWNDPHAQGPGLYFVVEDAPVDGTAEGDANEFTDPMGANRWPVEDCPSVFADEDSLFEAARRVAFGCDGAVVVHRDGTIEAGMVRLRQLTATERAGIDDLPYTGWMGARHMSALETSTRGAVFAVVTLSEEDGRVTVFRNGGFDDIRRDAVDAIDAIDTMDATDGEPPDGRGGAEPDP